MLPLHSTISPIDGPHIKVKIPIPDINQFLHDVFLWSIVSASNDLQRDAAWHILSVVVNKRTEGLTMFLLPFYLSLTH